MRLVKPGFQPGGNGTAKQRTLGNLGEGSRLALFPDGKMPPSTAGREARRYFSDWL